VAEEGGIIEGVLGGGAEGPDADLAAALDPIAAALATTLSRSEETVAPDLKAYLAQQRELVRIQTEHLHEQRAVILTNLKLKSTSEGLRVAMQVFVALVATAIVGLVGLMVWGAARDHGLVVESFSVPPELAQRGLTGQVVAKQVLDRLSAMQAQTYSARTASSYTNNWGDDLKIEIPETGVSLGELRRSLRDWLGQQTRISGEVYRTPAGLTVTARAGEESSQSFSGPDADYDKLIQQAAEAVYARTQPLRYAVYLAEQNRLDQSRAILTRLTADPNPLERAWAHMNLGGLAGNLHDFKSGVGEDQKALGEVPDFAMSQYRLVTGESRLGHWEKGLKFYHEFINNRKGINDQINFAYRQQFIDTAKVEYGELIGSYLESARSSLSILREVSPVLKPWTLKNAIDLYAIDHDFSRAISLLEIGGPVYDQSRAFVLGLKAFEDGDSRSIGLLAQSDDAAEKHFGRDYRLANEWPTARAKARFGDLAGAQAMADEMPSDCYPCVATRGVVAATRGDRTGAERWFAEAIRQGPDLPLAYVDRGRTRLDRGDVAGALSDAETAHRLGPHFADAFKLWGDALASQGRWSQAVAKYDAALAEAPAWTTLKQARSTAQFHAK
jgi:tetratricopeptide (TPR) repeat protein